MTKIFNLKQIKKALEKTDVIKIIEEGFVAYSQGKVIVPPVGEMLFDNPPGETHIKYGFIKNDDYFVVKIASGFCENYRFNLSSNYGLMLLFSQKTGYLSCILFDEGYLTAVRTAAAGAVVAKYLAPKKVHRIGILGAGEQGRLQLEYLKPFVDCRDVIVWGVNQTELEDYKRDMVPLGFKIQTTVEPDEVSSSCNLIVTATPSKIPLVKSDLVRKKALDAGYLDEDDTVELGHVIINKDLQRHSDEQFTVADLTGVAVQDYQISKAVYETLIEKENL